MNGNNSDWLNDTLPANNDNNAGTESSTNNVVNTDSTTESVAEESTANINYEAQDSPAMTTINGVIDNINVEQTDDETYLEEYMGKNYEKVSTRLLNFGALFFTYLYLFYRKMYLLGLVVLIAQLALVVYVNPYVALIFNVILFFSANIIYTSHVKRKIEKIKNKSGSKLKEHLVNECAAKGGTNKKAVFLGVILSIVLVLFISFKFRDKEPFDQIANFIDNKVEDIKFEINNLMNND